MARVALMCPDLLFGSNLKGALQAAGHGVAQFNHADAAREAAPEADVVIADLTDECYGGLELGGIEDTATLAFYSHVDVEMRRRAEAAGFDMVVPRSRMSREGPALVDKLVAEAPA